MLEQRVVGASTAGCRVECFVCAGVLFHDREMLLNTIGLSALNLDWLNKSATGLVCIKCGYVMSFLGDQLQLIEVDVRS